MAEFSKLVVTNKGQSLIAKLLAGAASDIDFTKVASSSAKYTVDELEDLTVLSEIRQEAKISRISRTNDVAVKVETAFSNEELKIGYHMRTLGLYAVDPDEGEILYSATVETSGHCYMPPYNGITVSGAFIQLVTTVGNSENISLEVNPAAIATIANIQELWGAIVDLCPRQLAIIIPTDGWEADGERRYRRDIRVETATAAMIPQLTVLPEGEDTAVACGLHPACRTLDGVLQVWARAVPAAAIPASLVLIGDASAYCAVGGGNSGTSYTLPPATGTTLGGVKVGSGLNATSDGTISVDVGSVAGKLAALEDDVREMLDTVFPEQQSAGNEE